jgi:cytochrome oxidase Cu insertion factor (SCO1/SenC/PrrC family)
MKHINPSKPSEPVGLTVYDLPSPEQAATQDASRTRAGRIRMILVMAVCAAPIIFSYLTYYVIRPQSASSFGQLIEPQRDIPAITATDLKGQTIDLQSLRGQWLFVMVAGGACDSECERMLYVQRQLHKSLGREKDRVDRVWLVSDKAAVNDALMQALQDATVLRADGEALNKWFYPAAGLELKDHFYLVDPMGRWMMRFPSRQDGAEAPVKIKRDLERLLRAANSWDQAGR